MISIEEQKLLRLGQIKTECNEAFVCSRHGEPIPCGICDIESDEHLPYSIICNKCSININECPVGYASGASHPCHSIQQYKENGIIAFDPDPEILRQDHEAEERARQEREERDRAIAAAAAAEAERLRQVADLERRVRETERRAAAIELEKNREIEAATIRAREEERLRHEAETRLHEEAARHIEPRTSPHTESNGSAVRKFVKFLFIAIIGIMLWRYFHSASESTFKLTSRNVVTQSTIPVTQEDEEKLKKLEVEQIRKGMEVIKQQEFKDKSPPANSNNNTAPPSNTPLQNNSNESNGFFSNALNWVFELWHKAFGDANSNGSQSYTQKNEEQMRKAAADQINKGKEVLRQQELKNESKSTDQKNHESDSQVDNSKQELNSGWQIFRINSGDKVFVSKFPERYKVEMRDFNEYQIYFTELRVDRKIRFEISSWKVPNSHFDFSNGTDTLDEIADRFFKFINYSWIRNPEKVEVKKNEGTTNGLKYIEASWAEYNGLENRINTTRVYVHDNYLINVESSRIKDDEQPQKTIGEVEYFFNSFALDSVETNTGHVSKPDPKTNEVTNRDAIPQNNESKKANSVNDL